MVTQDSINRDKKWALNKKQTVYAAISSSNMIKHVQEKKQGKATTEYKRVRKFAVKAMKRESVLEVRTGNNDYGAGIAFDLSDTKDDKQAES